MLRFRPTLLALSFGFLSLSAPLVAHAQSMTIINEASLPRLDRHGTPTMKRALTMNPEGISARDCLDEQRIRVALQLTGYEPNARLDAWASVSGVDCASSASRASDCWKIEGGIPLQPTPNIDVPIRKLLAGAVKQKGIVQRDTPDDDVTVCAGLEHANLSLHFLYFGPGQSTPAMFTTVNVDVDTFGPPPPIDLKALPGNAMVQLAWRDVDPSRVQTNVYCTKLASPTCASPKLTPGSTIDLATEESMRCGTVVGGGSTLQASNIGVGSDPLVNGTAYAFAIASVDAFGNIGPLSSTICETPRVDAGQPSDSEGGCSTSRATSANATASLALLVFLGCILRRSSCKLERWY